jgi:hypothetical protein
VRPGTARETRTGARAGTTFRLTIGLGEVTVISGSWVAGGGAASCDIALLPIPQSTSQLAPLMWTARLTKNAMNQILIKKLRLVRRRQRIRSACRRCATDRFLFIPRLIGHASRGDPTEVIKLSMSG